MLLGTAPMLGAHAAMSGVAMVGVVLSFGSEGKGVGEITIFVGTCVDRIRAPLPASCQSKAQSTRRELKDIYDHVALRNFEHVNG